MDIRNFYVKVDPARAADLVMEAISVSLSGRLVDRYERDCGERKMVVLTMEKYFMRTNSRATLTLVADDFEGKPKVRFIGSGGGEGAFLRFDWGGRRKLCRNGRAGACGL